MAKNKTNYNVDAKTFVKVWETSGNAEEAATRLGMPRDIVHARASSYRACGIHLKRMPRAQKRVLNVEALNELIDSIEGETSKAIVAPAPALSPPGAPQRKNKSSMEAINRALERVLKKIDPKS